MHGTRGYVIPSSGFNRERSPFDIPPGQNSPSSRFKKHDTATAYPSQSASPQLFSGHSIACVAEPINIDASNSNNLHGFAPVDGSLYDDTTSPKLAKQSDSIKGVECDVRWSIKAFRDSSLDEDVSPNREKQSAARCLSFPDLSKQQPRLAGPPSPSSPPPHSPPLEISPERSPQSNAPWQYASCTNAHNSHYPANNPSYPQIHPSSRHQRLPPSPPALPLRQRQDAPGQSLPYWCEHKPRGQYYNPAQQPYQEAQWWDPHAQIHQSPSQSPHPTQYHHQQTQQQFQRLPRPPAPSMMGCGTFLRNQAYVQSSAHLGASTLSHTGHTNQEAAGLPAFMDHPCSLQDFSKSIGSYGDLSGAGVVGDRRRNTTEVMAAAGSNTLVTVRLPTTVIQTPEKVWVCRGGFKFPAWHAACCEPAIDHNNEGKLVSGVRDQGARQGPRSPQLSPGKLMFDWSPGAVDLKPYKITNLTDYVRARWRMVQDQPIGSLSNACAEMQMTVTNLLEYFRADSVADPSAQPVEMPLIMREVPKVAADGGDAQAGVVMGPFFSVRHDRWASHFLCPHLRSFLDVRTLTDVKKRLRCAVMVSCSFASHKVLASVAQQLTDLAAGDRFLVTKWHALVLYQNPQAVERALLSWPRCLSASTSQPQLPIIHEDHAMTTCCGNCMGKAIHCKSFQQPASTAGSARARICNQEHAPLRACCSLEHWMQLADTARSACPDAQQSSHKACKQEHTTQISPSLGHWMQLGCSPLHDVACSLMQPHDLPPAPQLITATEAPACTNTQLSGNAACPKHDLNANTACCKVKDCGTLLPAKGCPEPAIPFLPEAHISSRTTSQALEQPFNFPVTLVQPTPFAAMPEKCQWCAESAGQTGLALVMASARSLLSFNQQYAAEVTAATKIQSVFRGWVTRRCAAYMSRTLFVGNLPHEVIQEAELRALFQQFGEIEEIRVQINTTGCRSQRGKSRRFGFVTYLDRHASAKAIRALGSSVVYLGHKCRLSASDMDVDRFIKSLRGKRQLPAPSTAQSQK